MTLKKNIFSLIIFSIVFILNGYVSFAFAFHEHTFMTSQYSIVHLQFYKMLLPLSSIIGILLGGFWVDKWNYKKITIFIIAFLSSSSLVVQFYSPFIIRVLHRFLLDFSLGFLIIGFKAVFTEISIVRHRGKFLFILLNTTLIGSSIYFALRYLMLNRTGAVNISYEAMQFPFILLPLFLIFILKHLPDNSVNNARQISFNHLFKQNQRSIVYIMVILALLTAFANTNLYSYVTSDILFKQKNEILNIITHILAILATVLGVVLIDKIGRRRLLMIGIVALIVSAALNIVVSLITKDPFVLIGFLYFYEFIFMFSTLTTIYIIILEYLPSNIRGRGLILFSIILWFPNSLNNVINKSLIFNSEYNVVISSSIILIVLIIVFFLIRKHLIETNGKEILKINDKLEVG